MAERPHRSAVARTLVSLAIALGVASALYLGFLLDRFTGNLLTTIEAKVVDLRFRLRGPRPPGADIVVVAIDSHSTEQLGRWPWPRETHAALLDRLREWGATTAAFDVLFTEPEGVAEIASLRKIAATLPPTGASRAAVERAIADADADAHLAAALERTFDADAALPVLAFDFVFPEDLVSLRRLGAVLRAEDEQIVLDTASYLSRDENAALLRTRPPKLALGIRPVVTDLAEWSAALGFVNPVFDRDGAVRREQLVVVYSPSVREALAEGREPAAALTDPGARVQAYLPLAVAAVATHLRLSVDQLVLDLGAGEIRFEASGAARVHRFNPDDGATQIDFCGPAASFPTYSFVDVLRDELKDREGHPIDGREAVAGKLVFVGPTDPGLGDFFVTPFTARLPGVEKQANTAENLLTGRQIRTHRDYELAVGLTLLVVALVVALIAANTGTLLAGGLLAALTLSWLGSTYYDFVHRGLVWNWTLPLATLVLAYAGVTSYRSATERRAKRAMVERSRFIQQTFGRYLSDQVVAQMVDSPDALRLGGERRKLTIMMSDLRGFSALCERTSPEIVIELLNHYLATMTEIIFRHQGTIDEFIGDAILALFGAPIAGDDDAQRAVACALEMQLAMPEVNERLVRDGFPPLEMGIALNTGHVIVGNIGSERRAKYGVVGSNVNLTGRIESITVGGQVFASHQTIEEAGKTVETGSRFEVRAKGFSRPIPAYEVLGIGPPYELRLPQVDEVLVALPKAVPVDVTVLEGKHFSDRVVKGRLVRLSAIGADLECGLELEPLVNLKLTVYDLDGGGLEGDLYAKVTQRDSAPDCSALRFTWTPAEVRDFLKSVLSAAS